jgi:diguanylate cyclase (GGDEF)-like protein/PAS domain S-box-containing protein
VSAEGILAILLLSSMVVLAIVSTRVVGRRAARTVDQVTQLLERNEARFRAMVRDSNDIMAIVDPHGRLVYASPVTERILGLDIEPLIGTDVFDLIHPDDRKLAMEGFDFTRAGKDGDRLELRLRHADGSWRVMEAVATNLLDDPAVEGIVISARDLTDRRRAEAELREAQERFRSAFEHAPIGMALTSLDGRLFRVNRALVQILGRGESELLASSILDLSHPDDREMCRESMARLLSGHTASCQLEQRYLHHEGHPVWVSVSASLVRDVSGQPLYLVSQIEDIAERRASGEALAHQAIHDPLTGLPNRLHFVERLGRELTRAEQRHERIAVLFLDLDRFKVVNDSLGHSAGDRLLVAVADRLNATMGPTDIVARFGGDEFTILCHNVTSEETAELVAERLSEAIARPLALMEGEVFVTASIGIALSGDTTDSPETLLRNADAAMYRAKDNGRDRAELFDARTHHRAVDDLRTGNALHRAIERGEMRVYYQPMISLDNGLLTGFEALIRWEHPERGLVPPMEFVPLAEETGLIVPLGAWALEEACRQAVRWHDAKPDAPPLSMSVNLSPRQLAEPALPNEVARVLHDTGIQPTALWLEITESTLMRDAESAASALGALRALGLHVGVDDFGSGYSSLAYLERLPVEALKIDRSFIEGVGARKDSTAIVNAIVSLARALQLTTVAEGIETAQQLQQLRGMGCETGQGYLFGAAQPAEVYGADPRQVVVPRTRVGEPQARVVTR